MICRLNRGIGLGHIAIRIDQIADPGRHPGTIIIGSTIGNGNRLIGVAEQIIGEVKLVTERAIVRRGVETDPKDNGIFVIEFLDSITEPLAFNGSTRCISLRIPPEHHVLAAQLRQCDLSAILILKAKVRRLIADVKHGHVNGSF